MKKLKNIFSIAALFAGIAQVGAQQLTPGWAGERAGLHLIFPMDGMATLPPTTTNTFWTASSTNVYNSPGVGSLAPNTNLLLLNVASDGDAGLTFAFTGTATSTNGLLIYPSYDKGLTYSSIPIWSCQNIAPGAAAFETNADLDLKTVTTLAFVAQSTGTTPATNALLEVFLKSPKYGAVQMP